MSKRNIPESVREQLREAGRKRAAKMTKKERKSNGVKAWATRCKNAAQAT